MKAAADFLRMPLVSLPLVALSVVLIAWPVLFAGGESSESAGPDSMRVTQYDADFAVDAKGKLTAQERLSVDMPSGKRGIFKFWDSHDPVDDSRRLSPKNIDVSRDGSPDMVSLSTEGGMRYQVARVGDPEVYLSKGPHEYVIDYTIDGVLHDASWQPGNGTSGSWGEPDESSSTFAWSLIDAGWRMPMGATTSKVSLPGKVTEAACQVGSSDKTECSVDGVGTNELTIKTGTIPANTSVALVARVDVPYPGAKSVPWAPHLDPVLGRSLPGVIVLVVLSLVTLVAGIIWGRTPHEKKPSYPLTYAPPGNLSPAAAAYIVSERAPDKALVATLLHMAQRGVVSLEQKSAKKWKIIGTGTEEEWDAMDDVSYKVGRQLGVLKQGAVFTTSGVASGKKLSSLQSNLPSMLKSWGVKHKYLSLVPLESVGRAVFVLALIVGVILAFTRPGGPSVILPTGATILALPFLAFAIGAVGFTTPGVGTRRTTLGRRLWAESGGFHRILSTPSATHRFDFSAREDLYTAFIPFAVAFGCAREWASKYEVEMQQPAPMPDYYPTTSGFYGGYGSVSLDDAFASFESSMQSAVSSYQAAQAKSSNSGSSGGGSFGGSVGGGGGGGSW